jgi:hypothetical protein
MIEIRNVERERGKFLSSIRLIDIPTTDDRWNKKDDGDSPNDPVISNGERMDVPPTIIIDTNSDTNGG